ENGSYGPVQSNVSTYMANVEMPGNERYYSFNHSQIHFIVINTEEFWDDDDYFFDITTAQYDWIIDDLANNDKPFTIALFHRPCYSIRSNYRVLNAKEIAKVLEPIFIEYGVYLTFSGHDHYYYRTTRNDITHVVTGGAGAPLYVPERTDQVIEGDVYFAKYHYVNVSVTDDTIKLETFAYAGDNIVSPTITDTFEISLNVTEETIFFPIFISVIIISLLRRRRL
ncbi:MAG: metallophosphoesterase, partial [Candidatus Heimdallarchaeota archaeon]|nr:metallophosphoesterase [Candidatus Heimdallarchaeota archaeon]MCK4876050.1 metallophosphoesterase [Candidatus Heimdallarchaeota archaeon]